MKLSQNVLQSEIFSLQDAQKFSFFYIMPGAHALSDFMQ